MGDIMNGLFREYEEPEYFNQHMLDINIRLDQFTRRHHGNIEYYTYQLAAILTYDDEAGDDVFTCELKYMATLEKSELRLFNFDQYETNRSDIRFDYDYVKLWVEQKVADFIEDHSTQY